MFGQRLLSWFSPGQTACFRSRALSGARRCVAFVSPVEDLNQRLRQLWRTAPPEQWQSLERVDRAVSKTARLACSDRFYNGELSAIVIELDGLVGRLETNPPTAAPSECFAISSLLDRIDLLEDKFDQT